MTMTWREEYALKLEGALAEMETANRNLARTIRWGIERLFSEDKALYKKRLEGRLRSQIPEPQTKLTKGKKKPSAEEGEKP